MKLDLSKSDVAKYSKRYDYSSDEQLTARMAAARQRGYMTRDEFIEAAKWNGKAVARESWPRKTPKPMWKRLAARPSEQKASG